MTTPSTSPLNIAVIGCGAHTQRSYLPILSRLRQSKITSLIDLDLDKARTLARYYSVGHCAQTIDDIPPATHAAIVVLPHALHRPVSCQLMERGLHVLCEKPMATTKADAEAMVRSAQTYGVQLTIGNVFRFYWSSRRLKEIIESRELGDLISFDLQDGKVFNWPTSSGFYYDKLASGGGVLIDTGAHVLDLLLWWLHDYPQVVRYQDDNFGGVESECRLDLVFQTSVTGSVKLSRLTKLPNKYLLRFDRGTVEFQSHDPSGVCNTITVHTNGRTTRLRSDKSLAYPDYFKHQLQEFISTASIGLPSTNHAASIIPSIQLIEECYQKATRFALPWLDRRRSSSFGHDSKTDVTHSKILITGASGFIGGRLVERLYFDHRTLPRCLVRNLSKNAPLSRFPVEQVLGDVLDFDSLVKATSGCDVVIHCAYGNTPDDTLNARINVLGTDNLLRASLKNNVKRFIYLSTVEVYGQNQQSIVDEHTQPVHPAHTYARTKLEAETLCRKSFEENSLPVVILRLAVVYGPYAPTWTVAVLNRLINRGFCLNDQFNGLCNPIYVDDCVDAIFLAMTRTDVVGETFVISGGQKLTWNQYFTRYNDILGMPPLRKVGNTRLRLYRLIRKVFDLAFNRLRPTYGDKMFFEYNQLRERERLPNLKGLLQKGSLLDALDVFRRQTYYSIDKARTRLGFQPQHDFDAGMSLVKQWLLHNSHISL